jgi:hypothetical protein
MSHPGGREYRRSGDDFLIEIIACLDVADASREGQSIAGQT